MCEAVGHEEVEHVLDGEADALVTGLLALAELVADDGLVVGAGAAEGDGEFAGLGAAEVEIDEEVVGGVEPHDGIDACAIDVHLGFANAGAIDHELQRWVFHADEPVGGVDARHLNGAVAVVAEHVALGLA